MIVIIVFLIKWNKKGFSSFKKKTFLRIPLFLIIFVKKLAILKSNNFIESGKNFKALKILNLDKETDKIIYSMPIFEPIGNFSKFGSLNFPNFPDFGN